MTREIIEYPDSTTVCPECDNEEAQRVIEVTDEYRQEGWECRYCGHVFPAGDV